MQSLQEMIGTWIATAATAIHVNIFPLSDSESNHIVKNIRDRYVVGDPPNWWEAFSVPCSTYSSEEIGISTLLPVLSDQIYIISEPAKKNPRVYRIEAGDLERLIDNCPGFEYSVAALDGSWLITESDHNVFYFCREQETGGT